MSADILAIIEFGAQKQRISLNTNDTYNDFCDQIYSIFHLDQIKSNYRLQRQDPSKPGSFITVDERSFLHDLKQHASHHNGNSAVRFRLVPMISKKLLKSANGSVNGQKMQTASSPSPYARDESDRGSLQSAATIDVKELIKKCLRNLRETTENIQLLDRCLHPEDYMDDESQSTRIPSPKIDRPSLPSNRQLSQGSSMSESRLASANFTDELVPALNHLLQTSQPASSSSHFAKPLMEAPAAASPPTTVQTPKPPATLPARTSNKSFSNRLGMTLPQTPVHPTVSQSKSIGSLHLLPGPKSKSPVSVKQPAPLLTHESNQSPRNTKEVPSLFTMKSKIELKQFEPGAAIDGIVSVASNASYFFLQLMDARKDEFDQLAKRLHDYYSNLDKNSHYHPVPGDFCVAMYTEDARWYRARLIRYISDQMCEVFYVDYGNLEELPIDLVHELSPEFARMPARAIACTIAEILPPVGQEGWTKRATFAFASRCSNERVHATVTDSTNIRWPMHMVHLRVTKNQEDVGSSLETCKVARRVSNREICEFWSSKIRLEQYILYNLPEPIPTRFPSTEQGSVDHANGEETNTLLVSSFQSTPTSEEMDLEKQDVNQTVSTLVAEDVHHASEPREPSPSTENEDHKEVSATPSSSLNPEAVPFFAPSIAVNEQNKAMSTGNETDDEGNTSESRPTSGSPERPRMPIKELVIVDTKLMPSVPLLHSWLPIEVTHIETPTRFYIRYIYGPSWNLGNGQTPEFLDKKDLPVKNVVLKELMDDMTECYNKHKRICPGDSYDEGELVAVKLRSQWHRGRFIEYKSNIDFAHIFFVDQGYTRSLPIQMVRPINNRFVLHAEQAHLVHLHQPGHRRGRIEWSVNVLDEFREMIKDASYLYARTISEPNTIDLMSYDPITKKWFSFYEHFVKHWNATDDMQQTH